MRGSKWLVGILCLGAAGILEAMVPAVASLEYFYAKDGTVTGRCVNGKMQTYSYDKKGQLTAVVDFATHEVVEQYVYDPAGNILSKTVNGKTTKYKYDDANQLVSSSCDGKTTKYEYDAAGRLVKEGTKSYSYGYLDKVLSVYEDGEDIASFTYHMDGQIATAKTKGGTESFLWDDLALISRNETEYVNEPYVTGGNPILANNKVLFNDMLGTTLGVKADKYESIQRDAFGMAAQESSENFFTGKPYIGELGYAFLFRNYRSDQGKWLTQDPLGYPDGWNNFAYCNNDLAEFVDPTGEYMTATYSISKHKFIYQFSVDGTIHRGQTSQVFSGHGDHKNNPSSQDVANLGPIPQGTYYVTGRESGGTLGWLWDVLSGKDSWFALLADDGNIDDYTSVNGITRGNFRLHPGSTSYGCITFSNNSWYSEWRSLLLGTSTRIIPGTSLVAYGTIRVIE